MKRNLKKEKITVNGKEMSYISFAKQCYNNTDKKLSFDLYIIKYKQDLKLGWDNIINCFEAKHKKHLKKEYGFLSILKKLIGLKK